MQAQCMRMLLSTNQVVGLHAAAAYLLSLPLLKVDGSLT